MKYLTFLLLLMGCAPKETSLEDVTEEVISKDRGVTIDIEPGQKR
jgi:hypothetical protein